MAAGCTVIGHLPTLQVEAGSACAGVGLDARVTGNPLDPRLAWLVDNASGERLEAVWPAGYTARFLPSLEIVNVNGEVVLRDGDPVTGGCVTGSDSPDGLLILP